MNVPAEAVDETVRYLRICGAGIVFITAYNGISGVFRGIGNSRSPFLFVLIACLVNVVLDLVFVGLLGMNAAGAALATIIAQAVSVVFSLGYIRRHPCPLRCANTGGRAQVRWGAFCGWVCPSLCRISSPISPSSSSPAS